MFLAQPPVPLVRKEKKLSEKNVPEKPLSLVHDAKDNGKVMSGHQQDALVHATSELRGLLQQKTRELKGKDIFIKSLEKTIEARDALIKSREGELDEKNTRIKSLEKQLTGKDIFIKSLQKRRQQPVLDVTTLLDHINVMSDALSEHVDEAESAAFLDTMERVRAGVRDGDFASIAPLTALFQNFMTQVHHVINTQNTIIGDRDRHAAEQEEAVARLQGLLEDSEEEVKELSDKNANLERVCVHGRSTLMELKAEYDSLLERYNSLVTELNRVTDLSCDMEGEMQDAEETIHMLNRRILDLKLKLGWLKFPGSKTDQEAEEEEYEEFWNDPEAANLSGKDFVDFVSSKTKKKPKHNRRSKESRLNAHITALTRARDGLQLKHSSITQRMHMVENALKAMREKCQVLRAENARLKAERPHSASQTLVREIEQGRTEHAGKISADCDKCAALFLVTKDLKAQNRVLSENLLFERARFDDMHSQLNREMGLLQVRISQMESEHRHQLKVSSDVSVRLAEAKEKLQEEERKHAKTQELSEKNARKLHAKTRRVSELETERDAAIREGMRTSSSSSYRVQASFPEEQEKAGQVALLYVDRILMHIQKEKLGEAEMQHVQSVREKIAALNAHLRDGEPGGGEEKERLFKEVFDVMIASSPEFSPSYLCEAPGPFMDQILLQWVLSLSSAHSEGKNDEAVGLSLLLFDMCIRVCRGLVPEFHEGLDGRIEEMETLLDNLREVATLQDRARVSAVVHSIQQLLLEPSVLSPDQSFLEWVVITATSCLGVSVRFQQQTIQDMKKKERNMDQWNVRFKNQTKRTLAELSRAVKTDPANPLDANDYAMLNALHGCIQESGRAVNDADMTPAVRAHIQDLVNGYNVVNKLHRQAHPPPYPHSLKRPRVDDDIEEEDFGYGSML